MRLVPGVEVRRAATASREDTAAGTEEIAVADLDRIPAAVTRAEKENGAGAGRVSFRRSFE